MLLRYILAALLALAPVSASAQLLTTGVGAVAPAAGGGAYSGPGDLKTYAAWYGTYAYSAAARGNVAVNVCNASDANCADLSTDATTGLLNVSGVNVGGTPCDDSGNICTIKTWYCQVGSCSTFDVTQATIGSRATLVVSCAGIGTACGYATNARYTSSGSYAQSQPYTAAWVANRNASTSTDVTVIHAGGIGGGGFFNANNDAYCSAGSTMQKTSVTDATWHGVSCSFNSSSSNITADASNTSGDVGTTAASGPVNIFKKSDNTRPWQGRIASAGFASSGFNTTELAAANSASQTILGY